MNTNVALRGAKILLKAVVTATNHEAQDSGLTSSYTRHEYGYKGLLNSGFSYAPLLAQVDDAPIVPFHELTPDQVAYITEGQDFEEVLVESVYKAARLIEGAKTLYLNADFVVKTSGENAELPKEETKVPEPLIEVAHAPEKGIEKVEGIPPFIVAGLAQQSIFSREQVQKIGEEGFKAILKKIKGAALQNKKFDDWYKAIIG